MRHIVKRQRCFRFPHGASTRTYIMTCETLMITNLRPNLPRTYAISPKHSLNDTLLSPNLRIDQSTPTSIMPPPPPSPRTDPCLQSSLSGQTGYTSAVDRARLQCPYPTSPQSSCGSRRQPPPPTTAVAACHVRCQR